MQNHNELFNSVDHRVLMYSSGMWKVLCQNTEKNRLLVSAKELKFQVDKHPLSSDDRYVFGYSMDKFILLRDGKDIYEIVFQIPCNSLTDYYLIPLDKRIQEKAWEGCIIRDGMKWITEDVELVFRITECIFARKAFSQDMRMWIDDHKSILRENAFIDMIERVFFVYAERLINKIEEGKYEDLYSDYLSFYDY